MENTRCQVQKSSKFKLLNLNASGKPSPPSLPLVVCGNYQWDMNTLTLETHEEGSQADTLHLIPQALELLHTITKPVAVLSICGPYRTGKSYFLSRLLGTSEIFKLGHTFDPCTRGIWISTTALECDEFVVVFLDTEGMDAIGGSETAVTNILIMNCLLSSFLIYNSQTVPEWSDLEDMSCFSQLSCSILAQEGAEAEELSHFFPDFLWLVRDQTLQLTTDDSVPLSPTAYLKKNVLVRSSSPNPTSNDYVVNAILTLFPSVECQMLPRPSADETVLSHILEQEDELEKEFISRFQETKEIIFQKIHPKKALDSACSVSGPLLAELAVQYIDAINSHKSLNLESSYLMAAENELDKLSKRLVEEYQKEMDEALSGKLPLEVDSSDETEHTLMFIHTTVMAKLRKSLSHEIEHLLPFHVPDHALKNCIQSIADKIKEKFEKAVVVLDHVTDTHILNIKGGAFLRYIFENQEASFVLCQSLINLEYQQVEDMIHTAFVNKMDVDIESAWSKMEQEYLEKSVGPAKHEVLAQKRKLLEQGVQKLKHIPGPPKGVQVVGIGRDRIKLLWEGVAYNEDVVDHYKLEIQTDTQDWTPWPEQIHKKSVIVDTLESSTKYWFRVRAISKPLENETEGVSGNPSTVICDRTSVSALKRGSSALGGFLVGSVASPIAATIAAPYLGPLATVGGLLAAPVAGGILAYQWYKDQQPQQGDLKPADEEP